jgi:undecaprenyl-diphosphatase
VAFEPVTDRGWWTRRRLPAALGSLLERGTLVALVLVAAFAWGFAALYDEVREGDSLDFDRAVVLLFRNPADLTDPIGPGWLESGVVDLTALGGNFVVTFVTLAVAGFFFLARKPHAAAFVLIAVLGAALLGFAAKLGFDRPRPDLVPHGVVVHTSSFPSGHAAGAAATYLTPGAQLARFQRERHLKVYVLGLAVAVTVAVGASRVYLGVHWPTDVLAGWTLGAGWALLCWTVARLLQRRGKVEGDADGDGRPD